MSNFELRVKRLESKMGECGQSGQRPALVCLDLDNGEVLARGANGETIRLGTDWRERVQPGARVVAGHGIKPL